MNIRKIRNFWNQKAKVFKTEPDASWGDLLMQREVEEISKYLKDGDKVLDVGCANGSSSIQYAQRKRIELLGIDYADQMIMYAKIAWKKLPSIIRKRVQFRTGNALNLDVKSNYYDVVISTRCICNLKSWKDQMIAINEMAKGLKPGGLLLLSEPTFEGLASINALSKTFGLKPLSSPWHNLYIHESRLLADTKKLFATKIDNFSSTYYFLSRIVYRKLMGDDFSKLQRKSICNIIGIKLPSIGTCGIQRLYIMKKR